MIRVLLIMILPFMAYAQPSFSGEQFIIENVEGLNTVLTVDLDNDGLQDIVVSNFNNGNDGIGWLRNLGNGTFSNRVFIGAPATRVTTGDIDNDGDEDLVVLNRPLDEVYWLENLDGTDTFSDKNSIATGVPVLFDVYTADLNDDGFMDVLVENEDFDNDTLFWYANDGTGGFGSAQILQDSPVVTTDVNIEDYNDDGFLDILVGNLASPFAFWYPNTSGAGEFNNTQTIPGVNNEALELQTADFNGDMTPDIVLKQSNFELLKWYSNNGSGNFTSEAVLELESNGGNAVFSLFPSDIDNDDDNDILVSNRIQDEISWYNNSDGLGNFEPLETLIADIKSALEVFSEDLDNDGDQDIIAYKRDDNNVVWYENFTVLGLEESDFQTLKLYPNPVTSDLFFHSPKNLFITKVIVRDFTGKEILKKNGEEINRLSIRKLSSGIYFATLSDGHFQITKKIIKK